MTFDHYCIRPLETEDLALYFRLVERNRPRLETFFTGTAARTKTREEAQHFLAEMTQRAAARTYLPFVVVDTATGHFVAFLDLKNIDWSIPKAEMGCYVDQDVAGQGLGTQAFRLFCAYCFEVYGFNKLFLRTHETNTAAKRLAEGCGFAREGVVRWDYKTTRGELVDLVYYGQLNDLNK